jgi:hypothetical protein
VPDGGVTSLETSIGACITATTQVSRVCSRAACRSQLEWSHHHSLSMWRRVGVSLQHHLLLEFSLLG